MKNKESKNTSNSFLKSTKIGSKIDHTEATKLITNAKPNNSQSNIRNNKQGPSKTQIERLKKFYNKLQKKCHSISKNKETNCKVVCGTTTTKETSNN
jgi:hypothetical protein